MRWDSPFVLAVGSTLAIHLLIAVFGDALVLTHPQRPEPAPVIEMIDVDVPPPSRPPPPPPPVDKLPEPVKPEPVKPAVARHAAKAETMHEPPPIEQPTPSHSEPDPGGEQIVTLPAVDPGSIGVPVAVGHATGRVGRGGTGGGTGAGSGAGSGDAPRPMSVATIKKRAMPRGDYGFESTKEYPAEAKQLGIEGQIRVRLIVDEHGKVKQTTLLNKLGHGLDELALRRAAAIEFDPALDEEDRPVTSVVIWTFTMTLPR